MMRTFLLGLGATAMFLAATAVASAQNFGYGGPPQQPGFSQQSNGWTQRTSRIPLGRQQPQAPQQVSQVGYAQGCPTCGPMGGYGYGGYGGHAHGGCCGPQGCNNGSCYGGNFGCHGIYGSGVPVLAPPPYQPGPPSGTVTYPYYTVRGPRDFLMNNPPPLGP